MWVTGVQTCALPIYESQRQSLEVVLDFIRTTGVDVFAPAIGNAHGVYTKAPVLDGQRVSDIVAAVPIPIALHGGSGMSDDQFRDLIARGCSKVNISTALKMTFMQSSLANLTKSEETGKWDPPTLFDAVSTDVRALTVSLAETFGSAGTAR